MASEDTNELFGTAIAPPTPRVANRVDNIIVLRYVELGAQLHRLISIVKARGSATDLSVHEFVIGREGVDVASTSKSADVVLAGLARSATKRVPRTRAAKKRGRAGKVRRRA